MSQGLLACIVNFCTKQFSINCYCYRVLLYFDAIFLQPENVMLVDPNSTDIKIIDFGLAKRYSPNEEIKVLSGTPAFAGKIINLRDLILLR